ncbi:hypothetical protein IEQ34_021589 [Dendrobium chrysotoxum]|uniref:Uncharacterized protein n=1 Tax=Dendrobium chrysotoxum TaxID=161865 RepID=A0AAV7G3Y3_DENCH|nr:hypothetical protein IEQ34_021589 [Dendrobium chrysotoxum]
MRPTTTAESIDNRIIVTDFAIPVLPGADSVDSFRQQGLAIVANVDERSFYPHIPVSKVYRLQNPGMAPRRKNAAATRGTHATRTVEEAPPIPRGPRSLGRRGAIAPNSDIIVLITMMT